MAAGRADILVGAPYDDTGAEDAGAVLLFDSHTRAHLRTLTSPRPQEGAFFGAAVASVGSNVIAGAPFDVGGRGAVYLLEGGTGNFARSFERPNGETGDLFGSAVASAGDAVVVGAPGADVTEGSALVADAGAVFVFDAATGALRTTLRAPSPVAGAQFGTSVAALGLDVLVGEPLGEVDPETIDVGAVYLFDGHTGNLVATIANPLGRSRSLFGFSVASEGGNVLVGAPGARRAFFFEPCGPSCPQQSVRRGSPRVAMSPLAVAQQAPACVGGYCFDDDPCTTDVCDVAQGGCVFERSPVCGCRTSLDCDDAAKCNGLEACAACVGCFLHVWPCCGAPSECVPGTSPPTGTACNDGDRCPTPGTCENGACVCANVAGPGTGCSKCHDGDPCTYDQCDAGGGCVFAAATGAYAGLCAFDRPFPGPACVAAHLPGAVAARFEKARRLALKSEGKRRRRAARLLARSARLLAKAASIVDRQPADRLPPECRQGLSADLRDAIERLRERVKELKAPGGG